MGETGAAGSARGAPPAAAWWRAFMSSSTWRHEGRDETCPVSTGRGTRRVHLVQQGAATVTVNGFTFDTDEVSISRLANALLATSAEADTFVLQWSLADTGTGVMTDVTREDIKQAHMLAVLHMSQIWSI